MLTKSKLFEVSPDKMYKIVIRIVPSWNPGNYADKPHLDLELTPPDAVSVDIHTEIDVLKGELERADAIGLHEFLALLKK